METLNGDVQERDGDYESCLFRDVNLEVGIIVGRE